MWMDGQAAVHKREERVRMTFDIVTSRECVPQVESGKQAVKGSQVQKHAISVVVSSCLHRHIPPP